MKMFVKMCNIFLGVRFVQNTSGGFQPDQCMKYQAVTNGINLKLKVILSIR
jgi:hypothetical protein